MAKEKGFSLVRGKDGMTTESVNVDLAKLSGNGKYLEANVCCCLESQIAAP